MKYLNSELEKLEQRIALDLGLEPDVGIALGRGIDIGGNSSTQVDAAVRVRTVPGPAGASD